MEFLHNTTLVHLKIRSWSGEIKAQNTDITLGHGGEIPPKQLLDLGRKKIFPPEALRQLKNLRAAAERTCLEVGTRFMGGFAIPDVQLDSVTRDLDDLNSAHTVAVQTFLNGFEQNKQDWMQQNKKHAHIFNVLPTVDDVRDKFSFKFGCYKLDPKEGFEPDMEEVADQVLHEICIYCNQLTARLVKRKTNTSGKTLQKLLSPVMSKLDVLSFGNGRILTVLQEFKELHHSIPNQRITKKDTAFKNIVTFLSMCGNEDRLDAILNGEFSVSSLFAKPEPIQAEIDVAAVMEIANPTVMTLPNQQSIGAFF